MNIWNEKIRIRAPMDDVFKCSVDLQYFEKMIMEEIEEKEIRLDYDRSKPFIASNELTVIGKEPLFKITPEKNKHNEYLLYRFIPIAKSIKRFGTAEIANYFTSVNSYTEVQMVIKSEKEPNFIWHIFIKIIMFILSWQSRNYKKEFIKYVEEIAE